MRNRGTETWTPGVTLLRTTEPRDGPSALAGPDWISTSEPATIDHVVAPGEMGRFGFTVRAPTSVGDASQFFGIYQTGVGWFGDDGGPVDRWLELRVTVEAVSSTDPDVDGDGAPSSRDCDDTRADVYPGAPEVCGDGVDQNCDGVDAVCAMIGEDAGRAGDDASLTRDDAGAAADASAPTHATHVASGCACGVGAPRAPSGVGLVVLALALVGRRRRAIRNAQAR